MQIDFKPVVILSAVGVRKLNFGAAVLAWMKRAVITTAESNILSIKANMTANKLLFRVEELSSNKPHPLYKGVFPFVPKFVWCDQ